MLLDLHRFPQSDCAHCQVAPELYQPICVRRVPFPVGALADVAPQLRQQKPAWANMIDNVKTVQTQAFQIWTHPDTEGLIKPPRGTEKKLPEPPIYGGFAQPYKTCADMSHLLPRENWPAQDGPEGVYYFCGPMVEPSLVPMSNDFGYPAESAMRVKVRAEGSVRMVNSCSLARFPRGIRAVSPIPGTLTYCINRQALCPCNRRFSMASSGAVILTRQSDTSFLSKAARRAGSERAIPAMTISFAPETGPIPGSITAAWKLRPCLAWKHRERYAAFPRSSLERITPRKPRSNWIDLRFQRSFSQSSRVVPRCRQAPIIEFGKYPSHRLD